MSILVSFQLTRPFQPQKIQPVLARALETSGLSTILVTGIVAEKVGLPRTIGALSIAKAPGSIIYSQEKLAGLQREWMKRWHLEKPSPIIEHLAPRLREMLKKRRKES